MYGGLELFDLPDATGRLSISFNRQLSIGRACLSTLKSLVSSEVLTFPAVSTLSEVSKLTVTLEPVSKPSESAKPFHLF
jgi:hypothetical protein